MRGVNKWRSIRVRSYVLPLLLGALALNFLIPTGFMSGGDGTTLTASMCSTDSKSELIEIPGEPAKPHCDLCMMPSVGPPFSPFNISGPAQFSQRELLPLYESQVPEAPLPRAQIPRGPPSV